MRSLGINRVGELQGQLTNLGSPGKMAVNTVCVCVCQLCISFTTEPRLLLLLLPSHTNCSRTTHRSFSFSMSSSLTVRSSAGFCLVFIRPEDVVANSSSLCVEPVSPAAFFVNVAAASRSISWRRLSTCWCCSSRSLQHLTCKSRLFTVATFQSASNSLTFPDISSYIHIAVQTARNIIDTNRNTNAQLIQQCKWHN